MKKRWIASKDVILCEALIDALTFLVCGAIAASQPATAVNGFNDYHREAFRKLTASRPAKHCQRDRDEAGATTKTLAEESNWCIGIESFRGQIPGVPKCKPSMPGGRRDRRASAGCAG